MAFGMRWQVLLLVSALLLNQAALAFNVVDVSGSEASLVGAENEDEAAERVIVPKDDARYTASAESIAAMETHAATRLHQEIQRAVDHMEGFDEDYQDGENVHRQDADDEYLKDESQEIERVAAYNAEKVHEDQSAIKAANLPPADAETPNTHHEAVIQLEKLLVDARQLTADLHPLI